MRIFLFTTFSALVLACCTSTKQPEEISKPNIILILTDDQGWGDLSLSGNPDLSTPNIDNLAASGAILDRFFVQPVCSPTRAEILTGRYAVRGGVYDTSEGGERLDLDETTIGDVFKNAGYKTAAYGKWHNGMQYPYHPNGRGFDDFYGFCSGHWGNYVNPMLERNGQITRGEGFIIDDLTNAGIDFISQNQDEPFFLYLPYNTPHSPMQVPDKWWDKFKDKELTTNHKNRSKEHIEKTKAAYALCENIDWNVGRIAKTLDSLNLTENTIVIYLSDNGPNGNRWNGGMKGIKGKTDEGGVRSPAIISWPGIIPGGLKIEKIAGAIDFLPTLTDIAGINYESKKLDGISLKPLLTQQDASWKDRLIFSFWNDRLSVRSQGFRLDHQDQLFNMIADPEQTLDVSDDFPDVKKELTNAKKGWMADVRAELPEVDTRTFPVGHPDYQFTQIPARDGTAHGNIIRSNRWPNCSFFTNWLSTTDSITWDIDVVESGDFKVVVYYTCAEENTGTEINLSFGDNVISESITEAHNPPLYGQEWDRYERGESYVKDFKPLDMGNITLTKGQGVLKLTAPEIPGNASIDFRLLMLERVN